MTRELPATRPAIHPTPATILLTAACFGLATGLGEGVLLNLLRLWPNSMAWPLLAKNVSIEFVYLAPAVYLAFFLLVGLMLVGILHVSRRVPYCSRLPMIDISLFVFFWLACYAVLSTPYRLSEIAVWFVSTGIAVQLVRWSAHRGHSGLRHLKMILVSLVAILIVIAGATTAWSYQREKQLLRALAPARPGTPNVLVVVLDSVGTSHLSAYGCDQDTSPNLTAFSREGVLFENAVAHSPWTPSSHATMLTGLLPEIHGARNPRPLMKEAPRTLAEVAYQRGYATAAFSANTLWFQRNSGFAQGFIHFEDYFDSFGDVIRRTVFGKVLEQQVLRRVGYRNLLGRKSATAVTSSALTWIDANRERPFLVVLNYFDAHAPYISPEPFHSAFMSPEMRAREHSDMLEPPYAPQKAPTDQEKELWLAAYRGGIAYMDSELGRLFSELRRTGLLDNTLVIVTSDHGEAFGEHGLYQHGWGLHLELLRVPLLVRLPGKVPANQHVHLPVGLASIPATIESIAFQGAPRVFPGQSLEAAWNQPSSPSEIDAYVMSSGFPREGISPRAPLGRGWVRSLFTSHWHLLLYESRTIELFDWLKDPSEQQNLSSTSSGRPVAAQLRSQLLDMVLKHHPIERISETMALDPAAKPVVRRVAAAPKNLL